MPFSRSKVELKFFKENLYNVFVFSLFILLKAVSRTNFAPRSPSEADRSNIGLPHQTILSILETQSKIFLNADV